MNIALFINDDVLIDNVNLRYCNRSNKVDVYARGIYITSIDPNYYKLELSYHYEDLNTYIYKLVKRV